MTTRTLSEEFVQFLVSQSTNQPITEIILSVELINSFQKQSINFELISWRTIKEKLQKQKELIYKFLLLYYWNSSQDTNKLQEKIQKKAKK